MGQIAVDAALLAFRNEFPEFQEGRSGAPAHPPPILLLWSHAPPSRARSGTVQEEKRQTGADWEGWYQAYVFPAHERLVRLYQVSPAQVAMLGSVSAAPGNRAGCFPEPVRQRQFGGRSQVVVSREDFPTIGDVFQNYRPLGLEVVYIDQDTDDLAPYVTSKTLLVALSTCPT